MVTLRLITAVLLPLLVAADFSKQTLIDFTNRPAVAIPAVDASIPSGSPDSFGKAQSGFISSSAFTSQWSTQSWGKTGSPVRMMNSKSNVYIAPSTDGSTAAAKSKLVLRTHRLASGQTVAEIDSTAKYLYASIRVMARVRGASGACAGIFTYLGDSNEIDIEMLTKEGPGIINYTNQPGSKPGATTRYSLSKAQKSARSHARDLAEAVKRAGIQYSDWHEHRIDWVAGKTSFYIDGIHLLDITVNVPSVPSSVLINMWSDGGEWTGVMAQGAEATLEIETIDIRHN